MRFRLFAALAAASLIGALSPRAGNLSVVEWLDAYSSGQHARVVAVLESGEADFEDILKQLRRDARGWILAGGATNTPRRELVAATFALEAARAGLRYDWKRIQLQPPMCAGGECYYPPNVLYWKAPPLLIEWGCELLRQSAEPRAAERWWQLAALSVAQRSEDPQFLVGDTNIGKGRLSGEIGNINDEIKHLDHVQKRFPGELRFILGQGVARDRDWFDDAEQAYRALQGHTRTGGEATMRLGAMQMRQRKPEEALKSFEKAQLITRDPYVIFLTHYFSAKIYEQQPNLKLAESEYRRAVAAVPHAQSATLALAALLAADGRRAEANRLVAEMLAAPLPLDPWRRYVHADDRFWPLLIQRLRAEIAQ
jgi:tetratricopeptide (TPR) repeat protein